MVAVVVNGFNHQFQGWPDGDRLPLLFTKSIQHYYDSESNYIISESILYEIS